MRLSLREFLIKIWIGYIFFVVVSTEVLSLFNCINSTSIIVYYALFVVGGLSFYIKKRIKITLPKISINPTFNQVIILISIFTILIPLAFIAIYYPPNNWDSMTYHMSRVMHWIQNQNVYFYPTNNTRQLYLGPTSEYVILNWMLIFRSDIFSNLVQYFSLVGSVITSTLIVKLFTKDKRSQILAGLLALTVPMGIMQATTTQTDLITAFFLITFVYFGLIISTDKTRVKFNQDFIFLSLSFALGVFTKNTFLIFSFPFFLFFSYQLIKNNRKYILKYALVTGLICIMGNFPQWYRNYYYFGTPIGSLEAINILKNESIAPKYIISNLVRNVTMNLGFPNEAFNNKIDESVTLIHNTLGISSNDPTNTFLAIKYKTLSLIHEDVAGNFLIIVLFSFSSLFIFNKKTKPIIKKYYLLILFGWLLSSIILKWQPWGTRLQLPLLIVTTPALAIVLNLLIKKEFFYKLLVVSLIILSWPWVAGNMIIDWNNIFTLSGSGRQINLGVLRHKIDREKNYYNMNGGLFEQHKIIANIIKETGESNIALDIAGDSYEYPLWVIIKNINPQINIEYIRQSKTNKGLNFNKGFSYKIVIYDDLDTEKYFSTDEILKKIDLGKVKYLILNSESKKILYID